MAAFAFMHGLASALHEMDLIDHARRSMSPDEFQQWQRERTIERRHQETCEAIRDAGEIAGRRHF